MATQKCPKCRSTRVRMGYRPTSIFLKVIFRYHLLCDECNWEFTGFGIPGTVSKKSRKRKNSAQINDNFNQNKTKIDLVEEILSNSNKSDYAPFVAKDKELNKFNSNVIKENSEIISKQEIEEIEQTQTEKEQTSIEVDKENKGNLKRQKVKKKVKIKHY